MPTSTQHASPIAEPPVFGHELSPEERDHVRRLVPHVELEEWPGRGHFVHLADADRFAERLRRFAVDCDRGRP